VAEKDPWLGSGVPQAALDDDLPLELLPLVARYVAQPEARPTPQDSARLLARLVAEEHALALAGPAARGRARTALRVARWRLRLLGPWFWIASVVLLLAGTALTHVVPSTQAAMPLILLLPLTAVLSLAHVVRTLSPGLRAVEASSPLGFVEVTSGLVLVLVGFDCALGVAATLVLAVLHWAPFATLLAAWLGPLLLITGISLPIALRWGALPAAAIGGGPWLVLAGAASLQRHIVYAGLFTLSPDALWLALHLGAAAAGCLLLALVFLRGQNWTSLDGAYGLAGGATSNG